MRFVTMILTVMSLVACHVEGPGAEVKAGHGQNSVSGSADDGDHFTLSEEEPETREIINLAQQDWHEQMQQQGVREQVINRLIGRQGVREQVITKVKQGLREQAIEQMRQSLREKMERHRVREAVITEVKQGLREQAIEQMRQSLREKMERHRVREAVMAKVEQGMREQMRQQTWWGLQQANADEGCGEWSAWSTWSPATDTVCEGQMFSQERRRTCEAPCSEDEGRTCIREAGEVREVEGTKAC